MEQVTKQSNISQEVNGKSRKTGDRRSYRGCRCYHSSALIMDARYQRDWWRLIEIGEVGSPKTGVGSPERGCSSLVAHRFWILDTGYWMLVKKEINGDWGSRKSEDRSPNMLMLYSLTHRSNLDAGCWMLDKKEIDGD